MKAAFGKLIFIFVLPLLSVSVAFAQADRDEGIKLFEQGEYEKAEPILQAAVQANEKDRLGWIFLGAIYVKLKKETEAADAFRKAEGIRLKSPPVYSLDKDLKITSKPRPSYTDAARKNRTKGIVKLAVEFRADGKIGFVFPFQSLPDGLTESVVEAARNIKFEPAIRDRKPVAVIRFVEYSFSF
jgi:tetratricopeptide (TPR) repeat protein